MLPSIYPEKESEVDIITMEWDSQVKKLLQRVGLEDDTISVRETEND
jgi:hypothetical protein